MGRKRGEYDCACRTHRCDRCAVERGQICTMTRPEMLKRALAHRGSWDFVIIGGGATGVGVAVDAASQGYRVLLLEQSDFGKGTSSRSTKLVHGGVRYLEQGNISLVMEALKERGLLRQNAPHLVSDLAFVVPNYEWWEAPFYGIGLKVYNLLAGRHGFGASEILSGRRPWTRRARSRPRGCAAASSTTTASSTTPACWSTWSKRRPSRGRPS